MTHKQREKQRLETEIKSLSEERSKLTRMSEVLTKQISERIRKVEDLERELFLEANKE